MDFPTEKLPFGQPARGAAARTTAEKYGGSAMMKIEDGWFQVHMLIPQQQ